MGTTDQVAFTVIGYLIATFISFGAFKEERTALLIQRSTGIAMEYTLSLCRSYNSLVVIIVRLGSYALLGYLLYLQEFWWCGGLLVFRIILMIFIPIDYREVLLGFSNKLGEISCLNTTQQSLLSHINNKIY